MQNKNVSIPSPLFVNKAIPNVDYKYGPYNNIEEAFEYLGENNLDVITKGLTIGIITENGIKEYWFKNGVTFDDLIEKYLDNISVENKIDDINSNISEIKELLEKEQETNRKLQEHIDGMLTEENTSYDEDNCTLTIGVKSTLN